MPAPPVWSFSFGPLNTNILACPTSDYSSELETLQAWVADTLLYDTFQQLEQSAKRREDVGASRLKAHLSAATTELGDSRATKL